MIKTAEADMLHGSGLGELREKLEEFTHTHPLQFKHSEGEFMPNRKNKSRQSNQNNRSNRSGSSGSSRNGITGRNQWLVLGGSAAAALALGYWVASRAHGQIY
jgi:hypothetical protein